MLYQLSYVGLFLTVLHGERSVAQREFSGKTPLLAIDQSDFAFCRVFHGLYSFHEARKRYSLVLAGHPYPQTA